MARTSHFKSLSTLLVVAHPDDELLFFGPTLLQNKAPLHILCLSSGSFSGLEHSEDLANQRKSEFITALHSLGISSDSFTIVDDFRLRDGSSWNLNHVTPIVRRALSKTQAKRVITFDRKGVSGHKNHVSVYEACNKIHKESPNLVFEVLLSRALWLKYFPVIGVFIALIFSFFYQTCSYRNKVKDYLKLVDAFKIHKSQYSWYRKLYCLFSIYMWVNVYAND
ncbi:hypothetical protein RCL1_006462 [Eukaryota sp. TZLM3-RCL]